MLATRASGGVRAARLPRMRLGRHALAARGKAYFAKLERRGVIELSGADAPELLQGLLTNNMNEVKSEGASMHAAFLNAKGRTIAETIVLRVAEDALFLDLHLDLLPKVQKYLKLTKLRQDVSITDASSIYNVWAVMARDQEELSAVHEGLEAIPAGSAFPDPRWGGLGYRLICSRPKPDGDGTGDDDAEEDDAEEDPTRERLAELGLTETSNAVYEAWRLAHGVPEGSELSGAIPLECNLDMLNGVSFNKGCYTGQELVARTHFQGLVRKRLLPVVLGADDDLSADDGADDSVLQDLLGPLWERGPSTGLVAALSGLNLPVSLESTESGASSRSPGKLLAVLPRARRGLAQVRLQSDYETTCTAKGAFSVAGISAHVPRLPEWWDADMALPTNKNK